MTSTFRRKSISFHCEGVGSACVSTKEGLQLLQYKKSQLPSLEIHPIKSMYPRMTKLDRLQISSYALERSVEGKMITGPRSTIMFQVYVHILILSMDNMGCYNRLTKRMPNIPDYRGEATTPRQETHPRGNSHPLRWPLHFSCSHACPIGRRQDLQ